MKVQRFEWVGAAVTAAAVRSWGAEGEPPVEVESIGALVREGGDAALLALTKRYDAPDAQMETVRVDPAEAAAALAALDPEQRAVIVLRYLLDYTPGEIARMLELPRGTVNSRLRRG
ncbi:MAG TPA: sigma factor-like helix-turn-helix DNA-binding protein, partial [Solirubrobacterales bacterium]|nr:sigma factor-like helix-turn-helix DNA-binding protein [Solirubrobacterales bacterium]